MGADDSALYRLYRWRARQALPCHAGESLDAAFSRHRAAEDFFNEYRGEISAGFDMPR